MRKPLAIAIVVSLAFGVAGAAATSAQGALDPVAWTLAVQPAGATATPGGTITLALTATIEEGWHLYATKLEPGGPVATSITIPGDQVFSAAGEIIEPLPSSSFDGNFNKVLEYHEGKAVFAIPVKSAASASVGTHSVKVSASYQTCNDRLCLPARSISISTDVQVAK